MQYEFSAQEHKQIDLGIEILRSGGVIAFPTDTVYGLGCGAYNEAAVARIFEIKGRSRELALPLLLSDTAQLHEVSRDLLPYVWDLIKAFMPGGLTLVVPRADIVKDIITAGGETVAVRIPDHPVPQALIKGCRMPVVGTSANLSGTPAVCTAEAVAEQLDDIVDLIVNAGPKPAGKESTVIDVTGDAVVILREGAVSREDIAAVAPVWE
jgi:L-threonylcarbamoyladenylate synthase